MRVAVPGYLLDDDPARVDVGAARAFLTRAFSDGAATAYPADGYVLAGHRGHGPPNASYLERPPPPSRAPLPPGA